MYKLGIDVNTSDKAQWQAALDELLAQRPLVKSYVMDEIYNMMESGEAANAAYNAGDYFTMLDASGRKVSISILLSRDDELTSSTPCVSPPAVSIRKLAEIFINYMLSEEAAVANAEYIYYASPTPLFMRMRDYIDEIGEGGI
jgi:spermidine/putrescine transport system substrate-binding protein